MSSGRKGSGDCPYGIEVGAYLLGALEPSEQAEFERHLPTCWECQQSLEELERAVEVVAGTVERRQAPAELKRRIVATVEAEARRRKPARQRSRLRSARLSLGLAGALAALAVGLYVGLGTATAPRTVTIRSSAERGGSRTYFASVAPSLKGATVLVERRGETAALVAYNLPAPPLGKVYELWVAGASGEPKPAGLFGQTVGAVVRVGIDAPMKGVEKVMVTTEPPGGTLEPTAEPIIVANLAGRA